MVGAHALAAHGYIRATKDLDLWIRPEDRNAAQVIQALKRLGAPLQGLQVSDLTHPGTVFQIGVPPIRIDILTSIDGVEFDPAWKARLAIRYAGEQVQVLSKEHLIANKRASGRAQDLADLEHLERDAD
ncbi:MAG: hypothetical protein HJJLKODD_01728 [Phycisphaerae bacterium]|nr:hypothetical protein [Phycisphaerae bacterium]